MMALGWPVGHKCVAALGIHPSAVEDRRFRYRYPYCRGLPPGQPAGISQLPSDPVAPVAPAHASEPDFLDPWLLKRLVRESRLSSVRN